jgi:hypothetical protein
MLICYTTGHMDIPVDTQVLRDFIAKAAAATYAGGGMPVETPERPGFTELVFAEGDYSYRDSYVGFYRSRGMEVVRFRDLPVWSSSYGGGMLEGKEDLAADTFAFLKKAMSSKEPGSHSFRGPEQFSEYDWRYAYSQEGDLEEFNGSEEIYYKEEPVFFHIIIGGLIRPKGGS